MTEDDAECQQLKKLIGAVLGIGQGEAVSMPARARITGLAYGQSAFPRFRSFGRRYILPDAQVINQPNPGLWNNYSDKQIFLPRLWRTVRSPALQSLLRR